MSSNLNSDYLAIAFKALAHQDDSKVEEELSQLVSILEEAFFRNQKDVANELSRIAKAIEQDGKIDDSLRFKQRSCEIMLKRSMGARRRHLEESPQKQNLPEPTFVKMFMLSLNSCPAYHAQNLCHTGLANEIAILPDGSRWLKTKDHQLILIARKEKAETYLPVFMTSNLELAKKQLQDFGYRMEAEILDICGNKLTLFRDRSGQKSALADLSIMP